MNLASLNIYTNFPKYSMLNLSCKTLAENIYFSQDSVRLLFRLVESDLSLYNPTETHRDQRVSQAVQASVNSEVVNMDIKEKKNSAENATNGYKKEG